MSGWPYSESIPFRTNRTVMWGERCAALYLSGIATRVNALVVVCSTVITEQGVRPVLVEQSAQLPATGTSYASQPHTVWVCEREMSPKCRRERGTGRAQQEPP